MLASSIIVQHKLTSFGPYLVQKTFYPGRLWCGKLPKQRQVRAGCDTVGASRTLGETYLANDQPSGDITVSEPAAVWKTPDERRTNVCKEAIRTRS